MDGTYDLDLFAVLLLGDLTASLLVQVGGIDPGLQLFDFVRLFADFLDLASLTVARNLHLRHFASE